MTTATRSSRFWWTLIFMIVVIAPPRAGAASAPSATPTTDDGQAYFFTWFGTAKGSESGMTSNSMGAPTSNSMGAQLPSVQTSTAIAQGSAVVKFDRFGSGSVRDLRVSESYQYDYYSGATVRLYINTYDPYGPWHDHESLVHTDTDLAHWGSSDFFSAEPPFKRPDGIWTIRVSPIFEASCLRTQIFPDLGAPCILFNGAYRCPAPQTSKIGVVRCSPSAEIFATDAGGNTNFVLEANTPAPDYFSKHAHYVGNAWRAGYIVGGPDIKPEIDWTITARRIGKCRIPGEIPLNDNPVNPDINDEDIEMGVEYDGKSIDPDSGIAPLNVRVTCDQVPIKNAKVNVRVFASAGGHQHFAVDRPRGSLEWNGHWTKLTDEKPSIEVKTDDDGRAHLTFKAGKAKNRDSVGIAGIYEVTATSVRLPLRSATVTVTAKVKGLENKAVSNADYIVCRPSGSCVEDNGHDDDPHHKEGTHATTATLAGLAKMAGDFRAAQDKHNDELRACGSSSKPPIKPWTVRKLRVIDIALPMGGLFDDKGNWRTPHQTHGEGIGVDFGVNAWSDNARKICYGSGETQAEGTSTEFGFLMTTMDQIGTTYGGWDKSDLCQYRNVCNGPSEEQPWVDCCPDNVTCPKWEGGPGMMGPPCPGLPYPAAQCQHCPTDPLWHLNFKQENP